MGKFNIQEYLNYIGLEVDAEHFVANKQNLDQMYSAHVSKIPYQNFKLYIEGKKQRNMRSPLTIDIDHVFHQIVEQGKGGCCYQITELMYHVLSSLGYKVNRIPCHVLNNASYHETLPTTHNILHVDIDGEAWLLDPSFGPKSMRHPFPFLADHPFEFDGERYELRKTDSDMYCLWQCIDPAKNEWFSFYQFRSEFCDAAQVNRDNEALVYGEYHIPIRDDYALCGLLAPGVRPFLKITAESIVYKFFDAGKLQIDKIIQSHDEFKAILAEKFNLKVPRLLQPLLPLAKNASIWQPLSTQEGCDDLYDSFLNSAQPPK